MYYLNLRHWDSGSLPRGDSFNRFNLFNCKTFFAVSVYNKMAETSKNQY